MGYEIDFLPVGDKSKGGDAIALRFGDLHGHRDNQFVMVVDGGYKKDGEELVAHIKEFYKTDIVDLVLCTHPDNDHISGLSVVLEELKVTELALHQPWLNSDEIFNFVKDNRRTETGIEKYLVKSLSQAQDLVELAESKDIPVWEPYAGQTLPNLPPGYAITVLGPSEDYYNQLMSNFIEGSTQHDAASSFIGNLFEKAFNILDRFDIIETLADPDEDATSPINNSSAILHLSLDGHNIVFTGDAGVPALDKAFDFAVQNGNDYRMPKLAQIPHHGSKRNVGPTLLNRWFGEPGQGGEGWAYVSAPKEGAPKDRKSVV